MEAFVGPSDLQVNHKDADKTNNRLENLEYVTPKQNWQHAWGLGLIPRTRTLRPTCSHGHPLTEGQYTWTFKNGQGYRRCKRCNVISAMKWAAAHRDQVNRAQNARYKRAREAGRSAKDARASMHARAA